jgi:hypothetical protein
MNEMHGAQRAGHIDAPIIITPAYRPICHRQWGATIITYLIITYYFILIFHLAAYA